MGNILSKSAKKSKVAPEPPEVTTPTTPRVASPTAYGEAPDALPIVYNDDRSYIVLQPTPPATINPTPTRGSPRWTAEDQRNYIRMFLASNEWEEWNS